MTYFPGHSIQFSEQFEEQKPQCLYVVGTRILFPKFVESSFSVPINGTMIGA